MSIAKEDHNVEEMDEFLCEIAIMKSISRHPNVVALIGYCTEEQPMLMVMEYVGCGDLVYIFDSDKFKNRMFRNILKM